MIKEVKPKSVIGQVNQKSRMSEPKSVIIQPQVIDQRLPRAPPPPPPQNPPLPPDPTPPAADKDSKGFEIKILQFNCNGIMGKVTEIQKWLKENDIKIACLQETKLGEKSKLSDFPEYTIVRQDRKSNKGGGLMILVHISILFSKLPDPRKDPHIEYLGIKVDNINIINMYIPPASSCSQGYKANIETYIPIDDAIIVGDINAHDALWHSPLQDTRGTEISETIGSSMLGVLNQDTPTRLPLTADGQPTSPDISLASLSLLPYIDWETSPSMGSDHLPIIIKCATNIRPQLSENRTFTNFKKADWPRFTQETETEFSKLVPPVNIYKAEKCFRKILNNSSKKCIPKGRIKTIVPEIPTSAAEKMKSRDDLRKSNPTSPQIGVLNKEIENEIRTHRRDKWREHVEDTSRKQDPGKLFKLIKQLNGNPQDKGNQAIKFKGKYVSTAKNIANNFNNQYSAVTRHISSKEARIITRKSKKFSNENSTIFSSNQTQEAIKKAKASKALGPDGISTLHLKHLGPSGLSYLTAIFNLSTSTSQIPQIWKTSTIIPLLKPAKPAEESTSYRPVSLLCPGVKILERLLLPTLQEHLPIPDFQHGFRKKHSTVSALNELNQDISGGFNQKKPANRTLLLQIDLSKAFDMVVHSKLLQDLNNSSLPPFVKRWLSCYIHGRQSKVNFRGKTSKSRNVRTGVPQGAVTSPIIFNFYLTKLPTPPQGIKIIQYADDISIYTCVTSIAKMAHDINMFITEIIDFLEERGLTVSPEKSTVTLFTPDTHEYKIHPDVRIKGKLVKLDQTPKLLGLIFDTYKTCRYGLSTISNRVLPPRPPGNRNRNTSLKHITAIKID